MRRMLRCLILAATIIAMPLARATMGPNGVAFSISTNAVRAATHTRFITPMTRSWTTSGVCGSAATTRTSAAKYRNPDNVTEIWSGRGRRPLWLDAQLKTGKDLELFLAA